MIYTAICGGKDSSRSDIRCFTDADYSLFKDPCRNAKIFKVLSHLWVDTPISVWVDGNIYPMTTFSDICALLPDDCDMAVFEHPVRATVTEEHETVFGMALDDRAILWQQKMRHSAYLGLKLAECGVIIRRTEACKQFNEAWWAEICRGSRRDQLSFPVAVAKTGVKVHYIPDNIRSCKLFRYENHVY